MKKFMLLILLICFYVSKGQTITAKVVDASNGKPLSYAIILLQQQQRVIYTDLNGIFNLNLDSLSTQDSLIVQYLGYGKLTVAIEDIKDGWVLKMIPEIQSLQPVTVTTCKKPELVILNKKTGRIRQYIGPGPETRLIIMSRYDNITGANGYIRKVSILIDEKSPNMQVPVRLHWYDWNANMHMPGKELTDTNILVYPYKEGWNDFEVPPITIQCPKDWIVFGLEFIYPPEYKQHYDELQSNDQRIKWLSDMQNRWSLAMQYVENADESGFYIINNGKILAYNKRTDRYFIRPAVKFSVEVCRE